MRSRLGRRCVIYVFAVVGRVADRSGSLSVPVRRGIAACGRKFCDFSVGRRSGRDGGWRPLSFGKSVKIDQPPLRITRTTRVRLTALMIPSTKTSFVIASVVSISLFPPRSSPSQSPATSQSLFNSAFFSRPKVQADASRSRC